MIGFIERRMIFKPMKQVRFWQEPPAEMRIRDVALPLANGQMVHGWWCAPTDWQPGHGALHYSHGNSGNVSTRIESLSRLRDRRKRGVLIYDYPGFGRSTCRTTESGRYAAVEAMHPWLTREMNVAANRII